MTADADDRDDGVELRELAHLAAVVLAHTEDLLVDGLADDVALALVQNALALTEGAPGRPRVQWRAHAHVLAALLLLLDDPVAGRLATDLVETLHGATSREPVLAV